jgi:hypothetical protein
MAVVTKAGWELADKNNSSDVFKATLPQKRSDGRGLEDVVIQTNISTGAFDLYKPGVFGLGSPFASYSPSQNKVIPIDEAQFNAYYNSSDGKRQLENLTKSVKESTLEIARLNTGTDPVRNNDYEKLKENSSFSSLANTDEENEGDNKESGSGSSEGSSESSGETTAPDVTKENIETLASANFNEGGFRTSYRTDLRYPKELPTPDRNNNQRDVSDVVEFTMKSYGNKTFAKNDFTLTKRDPGITLGKVTLAIPPGISDSNGVNWDSDEFSVLEQGVANIASQLIEGKGDSIDNIIKSAKSLAGNEKLQNALITLAKQEAAGTKGLLSRLNGAVFNPNIELLFKGPLLREFSYTIEMSPRDEGEATEIKKIIRFFKQGMAVQRTKDSLFLKAPNVFNIKYLHKQGKEDHKYINMIKGPCALTLFNVDYTPQGTYMTHQDGAMISYRINMTFKELEPIYESDYADLVPGGDSDTHIGF